MAIGDRLRSLREQKGMSREQVADKLGLSYWAVAKYEGNKRNPDPEIIKKYADFFDISVDYIYEREAKAKYNAQNINLKEILQKEKKPHIDGVEITDDQAEFLIEYLELIKKRIEKGKRKR